MRLRSANSRLLLLAVALMLGQWLALAHSFEHPALQVDAACQICAHAQGLDGVPLHAAIKLPALIAPVEAPAVATVAVVHATPFAAYDIRGPPAHAIVTA